jgi:hypothetical protein
MQLAEKRNVKRARIQHVVTPEETFLFIVDGFAGASIVKFGASNGRLVSRSATSGLSARVRRNSQRNLPARPAFVRPPLIRGRTEA